MPDLVVLGHVSIDHIVLPGREEIILPGGAAAAVATAAAEAGASVGLVTKVGTDFPEEWMRRLAERVDVRGVRVVEGRTARIWMVYREDGSVEAPVDMGVAQRMGETPIPDDYLSAKVFHVSPIPPGEQLKVLRRIDVPTVSLDFNPTYMESYLRERGLMRRIISRAHIIFPNEREALAITGEEDLKDAAETLRSWGAELVVITLGERGVLVYGDEILRFPAPPVETVVDPTGAGDAFAGGFLAGIVMGEKLEECVRRGLERAEVVLKKRGSWSINV